ncbi:RNA-directed DNA polymerase, eukaryota [Tanacetum coccineum]
MVIGLMILTSLNKNFVIISRTDSKTRAQEEGSLNFLFPNRLRNDQILDLESPISNDEIRTAVWGCGEDKSPGPDGFTFEFFCKYWPLWADLASPVEWFSKHGRFRYRMLLLRFVALIPKVLNLKVIGFFGDVLNHSVSDQMAFMGFEGDPLASLSVYSHHGYLSSIVFRAVERIFTGVGISDNIVAEAAKSIGCSIMKAPFKYLGISVGDNMSSIKAWDETIYQGGLPTRSNLARRNVTVPSLACSLCDLALEDSSHLFFGCSVAKDVLMLVCRWWNLGFQSFDSYDGWLSWFKSIRLGSKSKRCARRRTCELISVVDLNILQIRKNMVPES